MISENYKIIKSPFNFNNLNSELKFLFLFLVWFPVIFSNYLPGKTEIFPLGLFFILFLSIRKTIYIYFFFIFSFFYTLLVNNNFEIFEYFRSVIPLLNIFLIYIFYKELDFKENEFIIKKSLKFAIILNYFLLFFELVDLDFFTYYFLDDRANEPGFINFSYNNRFNFFESEPSRASLQFFVLGLASKLVLKNNKFLIINFLIDIIFIRSLSGILTWVIFLFLYRKTHFVIFSLILFFLNLFFVFDDRVLIIQDLLINLDSSLINKIIYFTGHRLTSVMMSIGLFLENIQGYGFVTTSKYLSTFYIENQNFFNSYLEHTQMRPLFFNAKASLISFYFNLLFSVGIISFFILFIILKEIFKNYNYCNKFSKSALLTLTTLTIFYFDKGVIYPWLLFGYLNNKFIIRTKQ